MNELASEPCDDRRLRELALFAGAGGGILGGILCGFKTVCAVEIDPYCREVLLRRQEEGHLPPFPVWDDARTFDGKPWRGKVDCITAGPPCTPWSIAGKGLGWADPRNLFPETFHIIRQVRPRYILIENSPRLIVLDGDKITKEIAQSGYSAQWRSLSAAELGAPHKRDRLWIVADTEGTRAMSTKQPRQRYGSEQGSQDVADTDTPRLEGLGMPKQVQEAHPTVECRGWWDTEPGVCRVVDELPDRLDEPKNFVVGEIPRVAEGIRYRVDRLKALGNAQVPLCVATAWELLGRERR